MSKTIPVTITYLEQKTRPALSTTPRPPGKVAILRAENPPTHFYRYMYNMVGQPYNWVSRTLIDDEALTAIICHKRVHIYILYVNGVPGGFAEIDARHSMLPEIKFFGLVPDYVGKGYGRFFLAQIIDLAWAAASIGTEEVAASLGAANGPRSVRLETCTLDHPAALALYQKFGFSVFDQRQCVVPTLPGYKIPERLKSSRNIQIPKQSDS